jgi:hypothetical protein
MNMNLRIEMRLSRHAQVVEDMGDFVEETKREDGIGQGMIGLLSIGT